MPSRRLQRQAIYSLYICLILLYALVPFGSATSAAFIGSLAATDSPLSTAAIPFQRVLASIKRVLGEKLHDERGELSRIRDLVSRNLRLVPAGDLRKDIASLIDHDVATDTTRLRGALHRVLSSSTVQKSFSSLRETWHRSLASASPVEPFHITREQWRYFSLLILVIGGVFWSLNTWDQYAQTLGNPARIAPRRRMALLLEHWKYIATQTCLGVLVGALLMQSFEGPPLTAVVNVLDMGLFGGVPAVAIALLDYHDSHAVGDARGRDDFVRESEMAERT